MSNLNNDGMVFSVESKLRKFDQSKILYSIHSIRESLESVNRNSAGRREDDSLGEMEQDISGNFDLAFNHGSILPMNVAEISKQASILEIDQCS
jgi:uncharacterized protein YdaL